MQTIDRTNAMFSPTQEEIEHSMEVIKAYKAAISVGDGMAVLNGKLIGKCNTLKHIFII